MDSSTSTSTSTPRGTTQPRIQAPIDADLQKALNEEGIAFPLDAEGRIAIQEFRMEPQIGMAYIQDRSKIPSGKLPFLVTEAQWIYGIFHWQGHAVMIELSPLALEPES